MLRSLWGGMIRRLVILGSIALVLAAFVGWKVAEVYLANSELQSDMKDFAVQSGARTGLHPFDTEDDLRNAVLESAKEYGIQLTPEQVTVRYSLVQKILDISLAADYNARVNLYVFSFKIHFTPSSSHRGEIIVK